uniref:Myeloid/lymphoid or mixed-lineage leukemia translocated to, 11 n=1 Tax=Pan troglodytes TaxID=9598 RepID=K7DT18_PANTR
MSLGRCFHRLSFPQVFWNLSFELAESGRRGRRILPPFLGGAALQGESELTDSVTEEGKGVRRQSRQSPNSFVFLQPGADPGAPEALPPSLEHASN